MLALALSQQQRAGEAWPIYAQLTVLQPGVAEHWSNLGNCLCELGRERDALAPLQGALHCGGSGAELHYALARAWIAHGDARRALEHVQQALRAYPQDPEFQLLRARALVMLDEYEAAGLAIDALRRGDLAAHHTGRVGQSAAATGSVRGRRRLLQRGAGFRTGSDRCAARPGGGA